MKYIGKEDKSIYKVLLVDDSAFMRKWITNILHKSSRYIVSAETSNGREAILSYKDHRPDIVILDVVMNDLDGAQTLRILKQLYPSVQVIMCSSLAHSSLLKDCLAIGAKDFVIKPNFNNFIEILDNAMQQSKYSV